MDQLDILKKNWQSQTSDTPHFSTEQLKGLLAHKSTGIVKWLFIIAMIEFFVFIILGVISHFYNQSSDIDVIGIMGKPFYYGTSILHYTVIIGFIYLFYRNYRNISVAQPTRSLMKNILKTRRTMKWYIWYNLIYIMVVGMIGMTLVIPNDPQIVALMNRPEMAGKGAEERWRSARRWQPLYARHRGFRTDRGLCFHSGSRPQRAGSARN